MTTKPRVLQITTLDTKQEEGFYVRDCLEAAGVEVLLMNPAVRGAADLAAAITPDQIAAAAGTTMDQIRAIGHEGQILDVMVTGAVTCARALFEERGFEGIIGIGGSMGTTLCTAVMRAFPLGLPKVMVSTMASGMTKPFVGTKDILMLHSVADIAGLNSVTRHVFRNGALACAGMAKGAAAEVASGKPLVALSTLGTTDGGSGAVRRALEAEGYEVVTFHTNGTGGSSMDEIIAERDMAAVVDMSLIEITDGLAGGIFNASTDRGEAAIAKGVPTVYAPGNIDFMVAGPIADAEVRFPGKKYHIHNPALTAVRADAGDFERFAKHLAAMWNRAKGPVRVFVPLGGFSSHDSKQGHLYDPSLPPVFVEALKKELNPDIPLEVLPDHINDPGFAAALVRAVIEIAPITGDSI